MSSYRIPPLAGGIHLNTLSDFPGPPHNSEKIQIARGSRVLWIDDKPHNIVGIRRLLRSLGIEIVTAISSDHAEEILTLDNDFDLIITDVQRRGDYYKKNDGVKIHDGVNYVIYLRGKEDPVIRRLPIIFYAAYDWPRLVEFTRVARELAPEAQISNSADVLVEKVFDSLAKVRTKPIIIRAEKTPTPV